MKYLNEKDFGLKSRDYIESDKWKQALRQAVDWSIYLEDEADDKELNAKFEKWLAEYDINALAWQKTLDATSVIKQTKSVKLFPQSSGKFINKQPKAKKASLGIIIAAAAAVALVVYSMPQLITYTTAGYITNSHEQETINLGDGSKIRLAPSSAIKVSYNANSRNIKLIKGEAFFEVAHNAARPFVVNANATDVTVLGTGFDVRIGDKSTEIGVSHGRVSVAKEGINKQPILTKGDWTRIYNDGNIARGTMSPDFIGSWDNNRLAVVNRPISEVIADLQRYYDGKIIIANSKLGESTITGIFDTTNIATTTQLIVKPHNGKVTRITPWIIIIS